MIAIQYDFPKRRVHVCIYYEGDILCIQLVVVTRSPSLPQDGHQFLTGLKTMAVCSTHDILQ